MASVCVITGGGNGIGFEAAKYMTKDKIIVLSGVVAETMQKAVDELRGRGYTAFAKYCDPSNRSNVKELVAFACDLGNVKTVIHTEEVSANENISAENIFRVNVFGTTCINQEFSKVMKSGGVIVDVASSAAYSLPSYEIPTKLYPLADTDTATFWQKILKKLGAVKEEEKQKAYAYALSKNFVVWYAKKCAFAYGQKGIRVVSVSPGLIEMPEDKPQTEDVALTAENRMGKPQEIGFLLTMVSDERNGYLAGVDVLCDGGCTTRKLEFKK